MYFLQDNKVGLRPVQGSDVNETYLAWMNDPLVLKGLAGGMFPTTIDDLANFVEGVMRSKNDMMFAICDIESGKHIGNIKLGSINWVNRNADIGILVGDRNYWNKGVGYSACTLVIEHGFKKLNLHKIWLAVFSNNPGALKLYRKIGFVEEGCQRQHLFIDGEYHDKYLMAVFNKESK